MAFLALAIVPIPEVHTNGEALLSFMGFKAGGSWQLTSYPVDAALVLSGRVLTSYAGVGGFRLERMTLDRILPIFVPKTNEGSAYRIPDPFLSCSVLLSCSFKR